MPSPEQAVANAVGWLRPKLQVGATTSDSRT